MQSGKEAGGSRVPMQVTGMRDFAAKPRLISAISAYVRNAERNEELCQQDAFYDLYQVCVTCIEDNTDEGSARDHVQPELGRYVDYCAGFTTLENWATLGTAAATSTREDAPTTTTADDDKGSTATAVDVTSTGEADTSEPVTASASITSVPTVTGTTTQVEQPTSTSSSESNDDSGGSKAWIAGAVVPSVVVVVALVLGIWWYRRRKRAPKVPSDTSGGGGEEASHFDKPQLHSECVHRPSKEQVTSTPAAAGANPVWNSPTYEMPANEASAGVSPTVISPANFGPPVVDPPVSSPVYFEVPAAHEVSAEGRRRT
ncbi:hypothetical protein ACJ41O_003059 [Fusarium nematophilum]